MNNGARLALGSEAGLCLVDIDKPDIQLPEELPIFPHRTPFIEELNHILDKHQVTNGSRYVVGFCRCRSSVADTEKKKLSLNRLHIP